MVVVETFPKLVEQREVFGQPENTALAFVIGMAVAVLVVAVVVVTMKVVMVVVVTKVTLTRMWTTREYSVSSCL